jgi:hypothetical protein
VGNTEKEALMATTLRDAAQALLDKLDGRRSFGVELLAAEFADERRALRAALAAPYQAQPAGDAALPVVATWRERIKHLDRPTDFAERCAAVEEARDLRWALEEAYDRIASMRTEWGAEVAALTERAEKARDPAVVPASCAECGKKSAPDCMWALYCVECIEQKMLPALAGVHADIGDEFGVMLAAYHQAVWNAAERDEDPRIDYDMAGVEVAKEIRAYVDRLIAAAVPAPRDTAAMLAQLMDRVAEYGSACVQEDRNDSRRGHESQAGHPEYDLPAMLSEVEASAKRMLGLA